MFENLENSIDAQLEKGKIVLICQIVPKEKFRNDYNVNRSINNITLVHYDSSLCQNGKQVEIITKMIFELCYIEVIVPFGGWSKNQMFSERFNARLKNV